MKNAVMARYGIEEQNKNEPKVKKCPRCKSITTPKSRFCDICGLPLANVETDHEIDHNAVMEEMSSILAKYPDVLQKERLKFSSNVGGVGGLGLRTLEDTAEYVRDVELKRRLAAYSVTEA